MKLPFPDASVVLLSFMVGLAEVDQQTPLAVTSEPPLELTVPPETAVVYVIEPIASVVTVGTARSVVAKVSSFP